MTENSFEEYVIRGGHRRVEGWIEDGALSFLIAINAYQGNRGIGGSIAEIGVHHGRCFIALSTMRRSDEFGVAVDVFEHQELNPDGSGHGDDAKFMTNLEAFGMADRQSILMRDSLSLKPGEIVAAAQGAAGQIVQRRRLPYRRAHGERSRNCRGALASAGVIILNDWCNPDWPGVQEGFFAFMRRSQGTLLPFAYGHHKLFLTTRTAYDDYFDCIGRWIKPAAEHYKEVVLCGFPCHHLLLPEPDVVAPLASACGATTVLDVQTPSAASGALGGGWGEAEKWGRWTVGPEAEFTMVPPSDRGSLELMACAASFSGGERPTQVVTVTSGGEHIAEWVVNDQALEWYRATVSLPVEFLGDPLPFLLTFRTMRSPRSLGLSDDGRELGIRVSQFTLGRAQAN